jgi:hypothetical protein
LLCRECTVFDAFALPNAAFYKQKKGALKVMRRDFGGAFLRRWELAKPHKDAWERGNAFAY